MTNPVNPSHPAEYLAALATILPVGTPLAEVLIQKGISALAQAFPVLILNCPKMHRLRRADSLKQVIFTVHGLCLDRFETDERPFEQILADLSETLCTAVDNVDANPTLGLGPTLAAEVSDIEVDVPIDTKQIGIPLVAGSITITVRSPWYRAS